MRSLAPQPPEGFSCRPVVGPIEDTPQIAIPALQAPVYEAIATGAASGLSEAHTFSRGQESAFIAPETAEDDGMLVFVRHGPSVR